MIGSYNGSGNNWGANILGYLSDQRMARRTDATQRQGLEDRMSIASDDRAERADQFSRTLSQDDRQFNTREGNTASRFKRTQAAEESRFGRSLDFNKYKYTSQYNQAEGHFAANHNLNKAKLSAQRSQTASVNSNAHLARRDLNNQHRLGLMLKSGQPGLVTAGISELGEQSGFVYQDSPIEGADPEYVYNEDAHQRIKQKALTGGSVSEPSLYNQFQLQGDPYNPRFLQTPTSGMLKNKLKRNGYGR